MSLGRGKSSKVANDVEKQKDENLTRLNLLCKPGEIRTSYPRHGRVWPHSSVTKVGCNQTCGLWLADALKRWFTTCVEEKSQWKLSFPTIEGDEGGVEMPGIFGRNRI